MGVIMKKALKIGFVVVASLMTLFVLLVGYLVVGRGNDLILQNVLIDRMEKIYQNDYEAVDDQVFADFDLASNNLRFNEIQMLATHNSYKKTGSDLGKLLIGLGDSFQMADALKYGYNDFTTQLQSGIRSMEWDIRLRRDRFELTHVPLVDSRSTAPVMSKALKEIKLYSDANPGHLPIVILIEVKTDWMILDPFLEDIESDDLDQLNQMIEDVLGETLFAPGDMIEEGMTLRETITTNGWPLLQEMLGRVVIVLHPSGFTTPYVDLDPTLATLSMFPGVYQDQKDQPHAAFIVHNDPNVAVIQGLVEEGFIVRTRIDEDLFFDQDRFDNALLSQAQILSSDYTVGRHDLDEKEMIDLGLGHTVIQRD
jgi:hypothetical protein